MTTVVADLETDGFLDAATRIWAIGTYWVEEKRYEEFNDQGAGQRSVREGLALLKGADKVVFHNGYNFDLPVIEKLHPDLALDYWKVEDTMVMSRLYNPERRAHTLDALGEDWFGIKKHEFSDFSRYSEEMSAYLRQDIRLGTKIWMRLRKKLEGWGIAPNIEQTFAYLIGLQMRNGFGLDLDHAYKLLAELQGARAESEGKLKAIFPPVWVPEQEFTPKKDDAKRGYVAGAAVTKVKLQEFSPSSRQQIAQRLVRKYGWTPTHFTASGAPEISETILKALPFEEAAALLEYLRYDKMIGMLDSEIKSDGSGGGWLKHEKNGKVHGYVNTNGAVTGRCTHSKPNVAQVDTDPRMRACWVPTRKGWLLTGTDAEGLELRMMGHYLAKWDGGAFARAVVDGDKDQGTDAHSINMRIVGLFSRNSAKRYIYALIYGAGDAKLGAIIVEDAQEAGKYNPTDAPHLFAPNKKGVMKPRSKSDLGKESRAKIETGLTGFGELIKAVKGRVKKYGMLTGLDGRKLRVRSPHSALNTLLQSAGAVAMKLALILYWVRATGLPVHGNLFTAEKNLGWRHGVEFAFVANVHDEVQQENPTREIAEQAGALLKECITQAGEVLKLRCPLAGKSDIGRTWAETH